MGLGQSIAAYERQASSTNGHRQMGPEFPALVGTSRVFRAAVAMAHRVAAYPAANVLLVGETGTGKELFARAIHNASPAAGEPFVAINCSAIPETLLESELFGHEKGAFTDARTSKRGLLEVAGRGTVMLDEVNELPLNLQPKLLRVLEERRVRRLGALNEYDVTCRIIAATNKDLPACVEDGSFRNDLFYRLNVLRIDLPPLRDREGDVEVLADRFVESICHEHGLGHKRLAAESLVVLRSHGWLGNVRELKNTLESAIVMCDGDVIRPEHIRLRKRASAPVSWDVILAGAPEQAFPPARNAPPQQESTRAPASASNGTHRAGPTGTGSTDDAGEWLVRVPEGGVTLEEVERDLIRQTLERANGNRSLAARMLGISRPTVLRKIERYQLP